MLCVGRCTWYSCGTAWRAWERWVAVPRDPDIPVASAEPVHCTMYSMQYKLSYTGIRYYCNKKVLLLASYGVQQRRAKKNNLIELLCKDDNSRRLYLSDFSRGNGPATHIVDRIDVKIEEGDDQNAQVPAASLHP